MKIDQPGKYYICSMVYTVRTAFFIICVAVCSRLSGQYTVRINVTDETRKTEIYAVGQFNNWNPGDSNYKLTAIDPDHHSIILRNISAGKYQFKFTRGSWDKVESSVEGFDIGDRILEIRKDTTVNLIINGWIDDYKDLSAFPDTTSIKICRYKSFYFLERDLDSCYKYGKLTHDISKKIDNKEYQATGFISMAQALLGKGNTEGALQLFFKAQPLADQLRDSFLLAFYKKGIGDVFVSQKDYGKAKYFYLAALNFTSFSDNRFIPMGHILLSMGKIYFSEAKLDSAEYYAKKCDSILRLNGAIILLGDIYKKSGNSKLANIYYQHALTGGISSNNPLEISDAYLRLAQEYIENNQPDSGFYYSRLAFNLAKQVKIPFKIAEAGYFLSGLFEKSGKLDSAFVYQKITGTINDSIFSREKERQTQALIFNQQMHQQEIEAEREKFRSRIWIYTLSGGFILLLFIAGLLIRNNRQKQAANALLGKQKEQIQSTLTELKFTQSQLIQAEKMASLGELTAGIAHEIQNPLNFVNNFSEVSAELVKEMVEEVDKGNSDEVKAIAGDVVQNLKKINHHGKRAADIVKGMLQHSRSGSGQKEPTDINALADEYLRLAYHGMRAKDKSFNATMKTDFDESIGNINIIPQDIGRVILNLITNAFYVVNEKSKQGIAGYEPTVTVKTSRNPSTGGRGAEVLISVIDNGNGIPQKIVDKIFQPFFTTKPTGQGTGLGLSLSYDMVKAHGGELKVDTKEQEGTQFSILIPA